MFFAKSIYRLRILQFIRKKRFGLYRIAELQLWVVTSMRATVAETSPSVTIPAATGTARNVRDTKRKNGSGNVKRIYSRAAIIISFSRFPKS